MSGPGQTLLMTSMRVNGPCAAASKALADQVIGFFSEAEKASAPRERPTRSKTSAPLYPCDFRLATNTFSTPRRRYSATARSMKGSPRSSQLKTSTTDCARPTKSPSITARNCSLAGGLVFLAQGLELRTVERDQGLALYVQLRGRQVIDVQTPGLGEHVDEVSGLAVPHDEYATAPVEGEGVAGVAVGGPGVLL